jgi:malate synthase
MNASPRSSEGLQISAAVHPQQHDVLTPEAVEFLAALQRNFNARRLELLRILAGGS